MPTPNLTFGCNMSLDDYWDVGEFAKYAETLGYDSGNGSSSRCNT